LCALFIIIAIAFFIVLTYMVRNLKKLESWAMDVANGNLGNKIDIRARDEIGRLGDAFNHMLDGIIEKYHLQKFVSDSTRSMIGKQKSNSPIDLGVTGRKDFAFMFSDVRGFTAFSERNDPETVIGVLNFYLELQSRIIKSNRGDIDDYVGDAIMAHFSGERRIDTVIANAVSIMKAVRKANVERAKNGEPVFDIGIGIHGGEVVVGNIGSEFRMDFACVGDVVNLSSRLCSSAGPGEIVVSKELFSHARKKYPHKKTVPLVLKGKKEAVEAVKIVVE
jgi:adenylate cyclase